MGFLIGLIVLILVVGLVLKLLKVAIILALCVGGFMLIQNKLGNKRLK
jgi:hypothetical protein